MTIYEKIWKIQKEIQPILKDKEIPTSKGSYRVATSDAVLSVVRPMMVELGLLLIPKKIDYFFKDGSTTSLGMTYDLVDPENGATVEVCSIGQGTDTADKGAGKAMTYAEKYLLNKVFKIMFEDDPDTVGSDFHAQKDEQFLTEANAAKKMMLSLTSIDHLRADAIKNMESIVKSRDYARLKEAKAWVNTHLVKEGRTGELLK